MEPPAYVLAGDEDGFLSVLPARMDSKFFAVDVWKPTWKQQVRECPEHMAASRDTR